MKKKLHKIDSRPFYGFLRLEDNYLYPPDVCGYFARRSEAVAERNEHLGYYEGTKIVKLKAVLTK